MSLGMKKKSFIILSLMVFTVLSFAMVSHFENIHIKAKGEYDSSSAKSIYVSTIKEASDAAGFSVATPSINSIPEIIVDYSIDVNQLALLNNKSAPITVGQSWELSNGAKIRLLQAPGLQLPKIGAQLKIQDQIGEYICFETEGNLPPRIAIYWIENNIGYSIIGTIKDSLDKERLISIANSVEIESD